MIHKWFYLAILPVITACGWSETKEVPGYFDCNAICEGCEKCEIECHLTEKAEESKSLDLDRGS